MSRLDTLNQAKKGLACSLTSPINKCPDCALDSPYAIVCDFVHNKYLLTDHTLIKGIDENYSHSGFSE